MFLVSITRRVVLPLLRADVVPLLIVGIATELMSN